MLEFLHKIDQLLKKTLEETQKITSEKSDCQKFYYEILFINIRLFEGAMFLLGQFKERPLLQVSFVSVMRDLISNLILAEYISHKEHDPLAIIEQELEKIYSEHYRFTKKQKVLENILFSHHEKHTHYDDEFEKIGEKYLDDEGNLKSHLRKISSTYDMIRYIESRQLKDDKEYVRVLYLWYTEFSKIAHFGELTVHRVVGWYASKNENEIFNNYSHLLKMVSTYIVGLLAKICYENPVEESIGRDLESIWNFEYTK
ncbi:MAG: hypothetical protein KDD14_14890 [Saprospiraceae bacterium]|nr:hypothetical protein [Saprospiraceae bacterium]